MVSIVSAGAGALAQVAKYQNFAARLASPEIGEGDAHGVKSILGEVQDELAHLPASIEFNPRLPRAAS